MANRSKDHKNDDIILGKEYVVIFTSEREVQILRELSLREHFMYNINKTLAIFIKGIIALCSLIFPPIILLLPLIRARKKE